MLKIPTRFTSERTAHGVLGAAHLEEFHEDINQERAIADRGSYARGCAAGHPDPEVLAPRFREQPQEHAIVFLSFVASARREDAGLFAVRIAIELRLRRQH